MSGHIPCRCGRPITDGAHLCADCVALVYRDLDRIADRWPDLTDALGSTEKTDRVGQGHTKRGMITTGTPLNEAVSRAMRQCRDALTFALQVINEDHTDTGRTFTPPRFAHAGETAAYLRDWQIPHLTATTARETAEEIATDLHRAESATWRALNPTRWMAVTGCTAHTTTDTGTRAECGGTLWAKLDTGTMPDLICDTDPIHVIEPGTWERAGWKRRFGRPLNTAGLHALNERLRA